jgi:hypothetical protein
MSDKYIEVDGQPVPCEDVLRWARWFEGADRRVAETQVADSRVSTVFLGLDHSFGGPTPLVYETMVFGGKHDGWEERWATREGAAAGHDAIVKRLREGKDLA